MGHRGPRIEKNEERMRRAAEVPQHLKERDPNVQHKRLDGLSSKDGKYVIEEVGTAGGTKIYALCEAVTKRKLVFIQYDAPMRRIKSVQELAKDISLLEPSVAELLETVNGLLDPGPRQGQIEFASSDGKYHLVKHVSAAQLHEMGAFLENCLRYTSQRHTQFLDRIQKGEIELFTLQDLDHVPVLAIEYNVAERRVTEVKGAMNSIPALRSNYLGALFEAMEFLSKGTAYDMEGEPYERKAKKFSGLDITGLETTIRAQKPHGGVITTDGYIDTEDVLARGVKEAYMGIILIDSKISEDELRQFATIEGATLDMTKATDSQRASLVDVRADILDGAFKPLLAYPSLLHARMITISTPAEEVSLPLLTDVDRIVTYSDLVSVPSLRKVKSIRLKTLAGKVAGPANVLTEGVVRKG